ncbi:MAG: hypothetical protein HRT51_19950 [Colwellia sp.]|nr:hypothetical protein [Colwellia sp.]
MLKIYLLSCILVLFGCSSRSADIAFEQNSQAHINSYVGGERIGTIIVNEVEREYITYSAPANGNNNPEVLIVALHGFNTNARAMMTGTGFNKEIDKNKNMMVVYPQGLSGFVAGINQTGTQWDINWGTHTNDVAFIKQLVHKIRTDYQISKPKLFIVGESNGAWMTYLLACEAAEELGISAMATVGATIPFTVQENCPLTANIPLLHMHGDADNTVSYQGIPGWNNAVEDNMSYFADKYGCEPIATETVLADVDKTDNTRVTKYIYHHCQQGAAVEYFRIHNGGHTWPSANVEQSELGLISYDINANEEIMAFFKRF